jgi:hypothetical protein
MTRPVPSSAIHRWCGCALALLLAIFPLHAQTQAAAYRTITGTITDDQHEPLKGAVVELENPANHQIVSYVTGPDGHYLFMRVDSHQDFTLWATFRGHRSPVHGISMFDSHLDKTINIVCKTY